MHQEVYTQVYADGLLQATAWLVLPQSRLPGLLIERDWLISKSDNGSSPTCFERETAWAEILLTDLIDVVEDMLPVLLMTNTGDTFDIEIPYPVIADAVSYFLTMGTLKFD